MAVKANFLSLPAELRQQIFHHYFRVDGGYAYDADSDCLKTAVDNRPLDLALLYTCRTVANEATHLPLSLNSIKFTTLYRRDLNKLAGCFNFVSGLYHHMEEDFVLLLGGFLTPEMHAELALEYPNFGPSLANDLERREERIETWHSWRQDNEEDDRRIRPRRYYEGDSVAVAAKTCLKNQLEDTFCFTSEYFLNRNSGSFTEEYVGFSNLFRMIHHLLKHFSISFSKVECFFSHALRLLAQHNPSEFSRLVYAVFPQWVGRHSTQEFFNMRFDHWAIPSQSQVEHVIELMALGGMWDEPDRWYAASQDNGASAVRCREKIRFSAVANAIRFLETRIPPKHRLDIRTLILHEDLPSVNVPSSHAQGLAPFFRENPLLRVERRVDMMGCMFGTIMRPEIAARRFLNPDDRPETSQFRPDNVGCEMSQWLTDALDVTRVGIPAESFTLILEAGSYRHYFEDQVQDRLQREVAWRRALNYLLEIDSFGLRLQGRRLRDVSPLIVGSLTTSEEADAIESLANQTSPILRSDFRMGAALDVDTIINETQSLTIEDWLSTWGRAMVPWDEFREKLTYHTDYEVRLADNYEIQVDQNAAASEH